MDPSFYQRFDAQLEELRQQGLFKSERVIASPQGGQIRANDADVINLCANNYLGLASHPAIREAAHRAIDRYGYGMASVRFICGTQTVHKQLEAALSRFLGTEDTILYSSCWDANGGLFETVLGEQRRHHLRCAQSCQHHRRHPALQGTAPALRESQSRRARATPQGHAGLPHAAHRHRRRVLDGRQHRAAARDLRSRRQVRRARHGRRLACDWLHGRRRTRHAGALRRRRTHRLPHRHVRQGAGRRQRRLHQRQGQRDRVAAAAFAPLPVLEQHPAGGRRGDAARARSRREHAASCAKPCSRTRANSAPACRARVSNSCPASIPSSP